MTGRSLLHSSRKRGSFTSAVRGLLVALPRCRCGSGSQTDPLDEQRNVRQHMASSTMRNS